jgi:hypothetical protein
MISLSAKLGEAISRFRSIALDETAEARTTLRVSLGFLRVLSERLPNSGIDTKMFVRQFLCRY